MGTQNDFALWFWNISICRTLWPYFVCILPMNSFQKCKSIKVFSKGACRPHLLLGNILLEAFPVPATHCFLQTEPLNPSQQLQPSGVGSAGGTAVTASHSLSCSAVPLLTEAVGPSPPALPTSSGPDPQGTVKTHPHLLNGKSILPGT